MISKKNPKKYLTDVKKKNRPIRNTRKGIKGRFLFVKLIYIAAFLAIFVRLFHIQVIERQELREIAKRQYESQTVLPASRGLVYDRNGNILISNTRFVSFAVDPSIAGEHSRKIARLFSSHFGKPESHYLQRIQSGRRFAWLERRVSPDYLKKIPLGDIQGLIVINEPKRLYHYGELAKDLLGVTNIDNAGIGGIELQFDETLRGRNGYMILQRDGLRRTFPSVDYPRIEPVNGNNLVLTIDLALQEIAEEELRRGIERTEAEAGLVVMMDPKTGAVLSVANYPPGGRNQVVTDMFEPGSIFKIVTTSSILENNLYSGEDKFYAENGEYRVTLPGKRVRIIRDTEKYQWLTLREALKYSSNIVMAKLSDDIGSERFYKMARDFGFGIPTGIELPGEVRGDLKRPVHWSGTTLNTMSYGYEVGTTPLQIISAYAALANDGILMKPYIIHQELDYSGKIIRQTRPQQIRRVVSHTTADTLVSFLESVVESGTGRNTYMSGVRIAGKTGTARKYVDGSYSISDYTASFVGFYPVDDPQIVCLVMIDNPRRGGYYASQTSVPVFKNIAERIVSLGLVKISSQSHAMVVFKQDLSEQHPDFKNNKHPIRQLHTPDLRYLPVGVAQAILDKNDMKYKIDGDGIVLEQNPPPGTIPVSDTRIHLIAGAGSESEETLVVPDLRGLSIRQAVNRLVSAGLSIEVNGSGLVIQQSPSPNQRVSAGTIVRVTCRPNPSGGKFARN